MKEEVAIIIPAYNPEKELINLVEELIDNKYTKIIVIDDGSKKKSLFEQIKNRVVLLKNDTNKGKGVALKKGFEYCLNNEKTIKGVITVDSDGQHKVSDINKVYEKLKNEKKSIIFGSRGLKKSGVPWKSKLGNSLINRIIEKRLKYKIKDSQTGLRGIPIQYLKDICEVAGEKFEYEMNMLIYFIKNQIDIKEVDIETIYNNKNKSTSFRMMRDSYKIYRNIMK